MHRPGLWAGEWGHIRLVTSCKLGQMQKTTGRYLNVILLCHPESSGSTHGSPGACQWMWFAMIKTMHYIFSHLVSTISSMKQLILWYIHKISISQIHCMKRVCSHAPMNMFDYETFNASFGYRYSLLRLMSQVSPSRLFRHPVVI